MPKHLIHIVTIVNMYFTILVFIMQRQPIKRQPQFLKMMAGHGLRTVRDDANNVYFCDLVVKEGVNQWS